jgi:hypothetical protein
VIRQGDGRKLDLIWSRRGGLESLPAAWIVLDSIVTTVVSRLSDSGG